jgi:phage/conjugal plasmid C-4 type zinc finger TraR family protein
MDQVDIVSEQSLLIETMAIRKAQSKLPFGQSSFFCEDCGHPIPQKRRHALPGCTRCVTCQAEIEGYAVP